MPRCRSWQRGDRKHPSAPDYFYGNIGRAFARAGMVGIVISYRLAPDVKHPQQVKDVASKSRKHNATRGSTVAQLVIPGSTL